jgi:hypothetical protein
MAGFLTHLVQRTLAASPVLAPRLSGRYEGPREASESLLATDAGAVLDTTVSVHGTAHTQAESFAMPDAGEPGARHARTRQSSDPEHATGSVTLRVGTTLLEPPEVAVVPRPDAPLPTPAHARHDGAPHVKGAPVPQAAAQATTRGPRTISQDVAAFQPPSLQPRPHAVESRVAAQQVIPTHAHTEPAPHVNESPSFFIPSVDASPRSHPRAAQTGMLVEPRLPRDSDPQRQPAQALAAPTVHVTIGRIELRAAAHPPAPAPSRSAAKAPALSLSDYLERRAKAGPR